MKKYLHSFVLLAVAFFTANLAFGQSALAPDQNPNYEISRDKYIKMADSLNEWHSTTQQNTYKAIDFMADRQEAKADRRQFRRDLRLERARYGYNYSYYPSYGNYYYPRTQYSYYYGNRYRHQRSYNNYWWGFNFRYP